MGAAHGQQHDTRYFTGVGAFLLPKHVLAANRHAGSFGRFQGLGQAHEWRTYGNVIPIMAGNQRQKITEEVTCLVRGLVHLPVCGHQLLSHEELFSTLQESSGSDCCSRSAALVYACSVPESKSTNRTLRTCCADRSDSTVAASATSAASPTGYPYAPVEMEGKDSDSIP